MKLHTSSKVAIGYIILIAFLLGATYYIFNQTSSLTKLPETSQQLSQRRKATHQIITLLYEAENIGQTIRMGHWQAFKKYTQTLDQARDSITALNSLFSDSVQKARLDTLSMLLDNKENNMRQLLVIMENNKQEIEIKEQINILISQKDSIETEKPQIERKVIEKQKTYTVEKKNKKFFQRLAEAFRPNKEDTTQVQQSTYVISVDTISYESKNNSDTLAQIINGLESKRELSRNQRKKQIDIQERKLRYAGIELSNKVSQLLDDIEKDEQVWMQSQIEHENEIKRHTIIIIGGIAVVSIILAIIFFTIIWKDISKSNMYRRELEKAKEKAESLLNSREKLMLTITHDIKAPVGSILGYLELLAPLVSGKKPVFYLENIKSSAGHLLALVTSLLDYHRLEANKLDIKEVSFNAGQLIRTICDGFKPMAHKKGLELKFTCDENTGRKCQGDAFRIRQITENLISNAIKFTSKGEVCVHARLTFGQMHLYIKDTGCGMSEKERKDIFKAFTRLKSAQGEEGFGLGLSITQKLVELLDGEISVDSKEGAGTEFYVRIPVKTSREPEKQENSGVMESVIPDKLDMILIDDDRIQMELTKALIQQLASEYNLKEWNMDLCQQPEEVFSHIRENRYDILLTDIQMPAMNGFELMEKALDIDSELSVVAITARSDMDEKDFIDRGFSARLKKPFNKEDLKVAIMKACGKAEPVTDVEDIQNDIKNKEVPKEDKPDIDMSGLTAFAGDDREASMYIVKTFLTETENNLKDFMTATEGKDIDRTAAIAHKMLPNFQLIKAEGVERLRILESKRNTGVWLDEYDMTCSSVIEDIKKVIDGINDFMNKENIENG